MEAIRGGHFNTENGMQQRKQWETATSKAPLSQAEERILQQWEEHERCSNP